MSDTPFPPLSRRKFLYHSLLGVGGASAALPALGAPTAAPAGSSRRGDSVRVAAVTTEYRPWSHADVILGRLIQGYRLDVEPNWPPVTIRAMYVEQFSDSDISRALSFHHHVPIVKSIRDAILDENGKLAVDGVYLVGEHGKYPYNDRGQHLYPRRRFFDETVAAFKEAGAVVPVFNDKHLDALWPNAKHMYETAKAMKIPMMAGSSLPLAWRRPWLEIPIGTPIREALSVGYGGTEAYGFHALETMQCMIERRAGGEAGIASVQSLQGPAVWEAMRAGRFSRKLVLAALSRHDPPIGEDFEQRNPNPIVFLIEHRDGLRSACLMLRGLVSDFLFAADLPGYAEPVSTQAWLQEPRWGHFSYLVNAVNRMMLTGKPSYPVERTVITTGIIATAMDSLYEKQRRIETPDLDIRYQPVDHNLGAYRHPDAANNRDGGWVELFNGQNFNGWLIRDYAHKPRWEVKDGVLIGSGGQGYIATTEEFEDLELFAELRIYDTADRRGNSGIYFRCQRHDDLSVEYPRGYEVQCDHGDKSNPTGSIYNLNMRGSRAQQSAIEDGEWFSVRVKAKGKEIKTWVNGALAANCVDTTHRYRRGNVLLQLHHQSGVVEVRELRIRRI